MINILQLPDEIKLKIFQYLKGVDKIQVFQVCDDFERIGKDRKILEYLDFSYSIKFELKFHLKPVQFQLVTHLNLNGIYWIPSAQLRNSLIKFINLNELHVVDTQLSFRDLVTVLYKTLQVRKLAFSLRPDSCGDVSVVRMGPVAVTLTHLYVTFYSHQMRSLFKLFKQFEELTELWLIEPRYPFKQIDPGPDPVALQNYPVALPFFAPVLSIKEKLVISQQRNTNNKLTYYFDQDRLNLVTITKNEDEYSYFTVLESEKCTNTINRYSYNYNNIRYLQHYLPVSDLKRKSQTHQITGLNTADYEQSIEDVPSMKQYLTNASFVSGLRKWKGKSESFWEDEQPEPEPDSHLFKKPRISPISSQAQVKTDSDSIFARFTRLTPQMEHFEIIDNHPESLRKFHINTLISIKNWTILKHLSIHSANLKSGKFIIEVLKNCPLLSQLKICDKSFQDDFTNDLCTALPHARNLVDFRYERTYSIPIDKLLESLKLCTKLQRIYIQCRFAYVISKEPIEMLFQLCPDIVFFMLYVTELPETVCRNIKQNIPPNPQQIVFIKGQTYDLDTIMYNDLPMYHIEDMVCQTSQFHLNYIRNYF